MDTCPLGIVAEDTRGQPRVSSATMCKLSGTNILVLGHDFQCSSTDYFGVLNRTM